MSEGVVADLVAFANVAPQQAHIVLGLLADHKERALHAFPLEDVEDYRSPLGVGAIVESKRQFFRMIAVELDGVGAGISRHPLVGYGEVLRIHEDRSRAVSRTIDDSENIALALIVDV